MEKKVLIVDDDADIRDMISVALSAEGWVVKSTDSLLGALSILSQGESVDCMLLDYNLPGMPMEDFLKQARGIDPKMAIVLLTAADKVSERAEKYGIKLYLGKPFEFAQLRAIMQQSCVDKGDK